MSDKVYDHWKDPEWLELFYECHEDEWRREYYDDKYGTGVDEYEIEDDCHE